MYHNGAKVMNGDVAVTVFETERLLVRQLQDDDFEAFHALNSAPDIVQFMGDGEPLTAEQTRGWIETSQNNYRTQGFGCFAITSRRDSQFVGFGGLVYPPDGSPRVEIIYAFKRPYWGQGLASEFAAAMLDTGFQRWRLPRIEATIDPRNQASIKVVQKVGMQFVRSDVDEHNQPTEFYALDNPPSLSVDQSSTSAERA